MLVIGNDIVDLTAPENRGKSGDRRFRARVFTAAEEEWIDAAAAPDAKLWMLWAAKEAAFKVAVKLKPGLTFRSREYTVTKLAAGAFTGSIIGGPDRQGLRSFAEDLAPLLPVVAGSESQPADRRAVTYPVFQGPCFPDGWGQAPESRQGRQSPAAVAASRGEISSISACGAVMTPVGLLDVFFAVSAFRVHCLAQGAKNRSGNPREGVLHWHEEKITGPFDSSRAVRRATIHYLADVLRISPYFLAIHRPRTPLGEIGPPRVLLEGRQTDIDISLSHDGTYLAFAINMIAPSF